MITNKQIEQLETEAGAHGDAAQVEMCRAALNGDEAARSRCEQVIVEARRHAGRMTLERALCWAKSAGHGSYLVTYADSGLTEDEDPGSRCGFDDAELAAIETVLVRNELTLLADDRGLCAQSTLRHADAG